jgi:predicted PurR-regulated permease PerM
VKREHVFVVILLSLVFLSFYLLYQILSPFLESILWAIFLAMIFYPGFKKLQRVLKRKGFLPALSMTIIVTLVIVIPFSYLIIFLANEIVDVYQSLEWMIKTGRLQAYLQQASSIPVLKEILAKLEEAFDFIRIDPTSLFLNNLQQIGTFLFNQSSKVLRVSPPSSSVLSPLLSLITC